MVSSANIFDHVRIFALNRHKNLADSLANIFYYKFKAKASIYSAMKEIILLIVIIFGQLFSLA